ncbi:lambda-exonuclease family protein [Hydrogenophaga aromaticivorans]|uniref:lambda-exonuclease family protein n=1 Tax=Hydrogenophaga aromaticivorans TaxID=2610898 RepID=UPI001B373A30|nr:YqaJ viral recombinase family protein [Hydrogenophaga aromaticivorans]
MIYHDFAQGSPEWHLHRSTHFNASDAPAMMGCSPYQTRTELLTRMKTGISVEVDAGTQKRFDDGHRFEALARPLAEKIIGDDLYPVTGSRGELSASFDGLTLDGDTAFEHKSLNVDLSYTPWDEGNGYHLPLHYQVQMEQQLLVSGAERVLFMASCWTFSDSLVEERHCWYASDASLRAKIVAGWAQFAKDLIEFTPEAKAAPVIAAPVETLPAVSVKVDGALAIVSNLPDFGVALRNFIAKIPEQPSTDQEFADTDAACKALKRAEDALDAAESNALAQLSDVDTMRRFVADFKALARTTRLQREKLVAQRKESIKGEIVAAGIAAMAKHIRELNAAMPANYMPVVPADFGGAIKGLRTIDSITNAVDTELARVKIAANDIANRIHANLAALRDAGIGIPPDLATLVIKATDDFAAVIAQRVAAEKAKEEAQRERIRAEEAARLEREAAAKAAAEKAEADRLEREERAEKNAMAMQEIQGIQQQVFIAITGRGRRVGGTIECIRETLAETEAWKIEESNFGALTGSAQAVKDKAVADIKNMLAKAEERERSKASQVGSEISQQGADALAYAVAAPAEKAFGASISSGTGGFKIIGVDLASKPDIGTPADNGARLTLGQLNDRLAPVSINVAGLATLGFEPVDQIKSARYFRECDFPAICKAISAHVLAACATEVVA